MNPLVDLMNRPTTPAPRGIAALLRPPVVSYSYAYAWVIVGVGVLDTYSSQACRPRVQARRSLSVENANDP